MERELSAHEELAALLRYPDRRYREHLDRAITVLSVALPEAANALDQFAARLEGLALDELQELFTQTVDVDPPCSLNLADHLDRDDALDALLAEVARAPDQAGSGPVTRAPYPLGDVVVLLARLPPTDSEALVRLVVAPAVERMRTAFAARRNPYELVLRAAYWFLFERHVPRAPRPSPPHSGAARGDEKERTL